MEKCFGIIPIRKKDSRFQVFLVKHKQDEYWGFPKGHIKEHEDEKKGAIRELKEETNLDIDRFLEGRFFEKYSFVRNDKKILKKVVYFLAFVKGDVFLQKKEILDGKWFDFKDGIDKVTYQESKDIFLNIKKIFEKDVFYRK